MDGGLWEGDCPELSCMDIETKDDSEAMAPPRGCQHYADLTEMPWDIQKFVLCNLAFSTIALLIIS